LEGETIEAKSPINMKGGKIWIKIIVASLPGAVWPGFFTEGDAAQVGDEDLRQTELCAGPAEHPVAYRAGSYDGIGAAGYGVFEVLLLDVNGKLPVNVDEGPGAAEGVHPLILPGWPFHADKLEDLIQKGIIFMHPSGGAVSLVGDLLAQPGDFIFVVS